MALILRGRGVERVRPLAGGFQAWRDRGYPMSRVSANTDVARMNVTAQPPR